MRRFIYPVLFIALFMIGGCGKDSSSVNDINVTESEGNMEVAFAEKAGLLVAKSIGGKAGAMAMGEILKLLGLNSDGTQAELDNMKNMLHDITTEIEVIGNELSVIERQMSINKEEIIANTNDPYPVLQTIDDALADFADDIHGYSLHQLPADKSCDISNRLLDKPSIKDQMRNIYTSIVTLDGVKAPILTNYQKLNYDKVVSKDQSLYDGYYNLERYTSQLLYYQVQALNLSAEAYNTPHTVGNSECNYTEPQETKTAVENYQNYRRDEIWNPDANASYSFIRNVWNYVMKSITDREIETSTIPIEVKSILQRAEFYRRIIVGDGNQTGANLMVIATDGYTPDPYISAKRWSKIHAPAKDGNYTYKKYSVYGPAYVKWINKSLDEAKSQMKKSTIYNIWLYSFSDANITGKYYFGNLSGTMPETSVDVKRYNLKYEQDSNGSVAFGLGVYALSDNSVYNPMIKDKTTHSKIIPTFKSDEISRKVVGESTSNTETYSGKTTYYIPFTYKGKSGDELYMHYKFRVKGKVTISPNALYNASAKVRINAAIYDKTDNTHHYCMKTVTHSIDSDKADSKTFDTTYRKNNCKVKLIKDHKYDYYIDVSIDGDSGGGAGYSKSWVKLYLPETMRLSF